MSTNCKPHNVLWRNPEYVLFIRIEWTRSPKRSRKQQLTPIVVRRVSSGNYPIDPIKNFEEKQTLIESILITINFRTSSRLLSASYAANKSSSSLETGQTTTEPHQNCNRTSRELIKIIKLATVSTTEQPSIIAKLVIQRIVTFRGKVSGCCYLVQPGWLEER